MKNKLLFLFFLIPILFFSQTQIGQDINGEMQGDEFGSSISLSSDGNIVAIAAEESGVNGTYSGQVRIYKNENGVWTQIGQDINGDNTNNRLGSSISLSSDGMTVAIGAPGRDGNDVGTGYARVFKNINDVWTQIGNDLIGDNEGVRFGSGISLSSDGMIVAIGAPSPGPSQPIYDYPGYVKVYINENGVWTQIGNEITRGVIDDWLGSTLSLSDDGNIVAIGVPNKNGDDDDNSLVKVYQLVNNEWIELGQQLQGGNGFFNVSLSSQGDILAIGKQSGYVQVFININNAWTQIGETILDNFGWSVSLSSNGSTVATGEPFNDDNGTDSGHVRVYDLSALLSTQSFKQDYFSFFPNPIKDILNISLNKGLELKQINIYNIQSQYLYSVKKSKIDVSDLSTGVYFIEVETNKGKSARKILLE